VNNTMQEARIAVVGMGIGRPNGRALDANPRGRVVALCDLVPELMEKFATELSGPVKYYTDYQELARDPEVDAVFVGTPNQYHVPVALEMIKHNKHVMITKPLADSEEAARQVVQAAEAAGVVNMMSLSTRFDHKVQYLGKMVQQGDLGEVYYARGRSVRRSGIPTWSLGFVQKGGGAFRDMGVHMLDAVWWLMGMPKPVSISGVAGAKFGPRGQGYWNHMQTPEEYYSKFAADDFAGGFIRFENGAGLQIESFWASHQTPDQQIELFGTEAGAKVYPLTLYRTVNGAPQDVTIEMPTGSQNPRDPFANRPIVWDVVAGHFIDCILDGVTCQAPLRHGLVVQEMMEALLRSAETGQEIRLD
jgi:predicted dehydrogenase